MDFNAELPVKLADYIKYVLTYVESSCQGSKIVTYEKYEVSDFSDTDINTLMESGMTSTFTMVNHIKIIDKETGAEDIFVEELEIPKMINNTFVIEGNLRIPTNTLDNDNRITVYSENIRIDDFINIDFEEDHTQPDGYKLTVFLTHDEEELELNGVDEVFDQYDEFKLGDELIDKLKVKLDTDNVGDRLRRSYVIGLIKRGPDKLLDNMIDKKIWSPQANLMKHLWMGSVRSKIISNIKAKYFQYNKIYLKDIQNHIDRYFKLANEKNIEIPSSVNPLLFDAMKYKVVIPETVSYNGTMSDIIDIVNSPVNGNINKINEMNVCAFIKNDILHIRCYSYPDQKPVEIPYTKYCTKKVLINQFWDYDAMKVKPNDAGEIMYKLRMKKYKCKPGEVKFDLIEPKPDDKLSLTSRRIPLGNMSDSVRLSMATGMHKQCVELVGAEPPLVSAGHDDTDFELSTLITKFTGEESVVEKIKDGKVFVRGKSSNSIRFYTIPHPTSGANDSVISFDCMVKVGQTVKPGDALVAPNVLKNKTFDLGTNVRAVYMNYLGFSHEDGIIISKSLANKLTHYSIRTISMYIYPDDIIRYVAKVGTKVKSKDILVNDQTRLRISNTIKEAYTSSKGLMKGMGISYNQNNLTVPNNVDEAYIVDVNIHIDEGKSMSHEQTLKTLEDYKHGGTSSDYNHLPEKYKTMKAPDILSKDKAAGFITFKLVQINSAKVGDKLANRYGSKGIISLVLNDNCMPQIEDSEGHQTPTDIILNPAAVISRKNISQLYECLISKCIEKIYETAKEMIEANKYSELRTYLKQFYKDEYEKYSDEELKSMTESRGLTFYAMKVGFYSKVSMETLTKWTKILGVSDVDKIYCPDVVIAEGKDGLEGYLSKEYVETPGVRSTFHELGYCEQPCVTGSEYIIKLYHSADYSGKVTSSVMDTDEPIMSRGRYRAEGQSIGEMETWILLETGNESFLTRSNLNAKARQSAFLNELLMANYVMTDDEGTPLLSDVRYKRKSLEKLDQLNGIKHD